MLDVCFPCGSLVARTWACDLDPAKQTPSSSTLESGNGGDSIFVVGSGGGMAQRPGSAVNGR